jgi:TonB family protein
MGGGVFRPGGRVSAPLVLTQVRPTYTVEALRARIQGSVRLELIVRRDGLPDEIRVIESLDPGLDGEAVAAARQWRFDPGRVGDTPVDVLVTLVMDFRVR